MRLHTKIDRIIESPYVGYWRICGKQAQKEARKINIYGTDEERESLLPQLIDNYIACLDAMEMDEKERKSKKKRILRYARK